MQWRLTGGYDLISGSMWIATGYMIAMKKVVIGMQVSALLKQPRVQDGRKIIRARN